MMKLKWFGYAVAILIPGLSWAGTARRADRYRPRRRIVYLQGRDAGAKHQP